MVAETVTGIVQIEKMKRKKNLFFGIAAASAMAGWIAWENTHVELNTIMVTSSRLPEEFSGFRIAQVSDLHNDEYGEGNKDLLALLESANPDMIAITGDLIDSRRTNAKIAAEFVKNVSKIAPCYYVTGNHESRLTKYPQYEKELIEAGAVVLRNEVTVLEHQGAKITVAGLDDPCFTLSDDKYKETPPVIKRQLEKLAEKKDGFTLLLCHRPELFLEYCENEFDLILTGHVHGGQFRLPFLGGIIAPNQGLFPKYMEGLYTEGNTNMVVSRGVGQSSFPFRVNNPPEVVLVELAAE